MSTGGGDLTATTQAVHPDTRTRQPTIVRIATRFSTRVRADHVEFFELAGVTVDPREREGTET
jgi:hypothetical protein